MRFFKKYLPNRKSIKESALLQSINHWFSDHKLWQINRHAIARGVAVGLFAAVIPLPLQMLIAALLAILVRGNLPVAIVMTWATNPFTFLPVIYFIYKIGALLTGSHVSTPTLNILHFSEMGALDFWQNFQSFITALGKTFFIGLPFVAIGAAVLGYLIVYLIWRIYIYIYLFFRRRRQKNSQLI